MKLNSVTSHAKHMFAYSSYILYIFFKVEHIRNVSIPYNEVKSIKRKLMWTNTLYLCFVIAQTSWTLQFDEAYVRMQGFRQAYVTCNEMHLVQSLNATSVDF